MIIVVYFDSRVHAPLVVSLVTVVAAIEQMQHALNLIGWSDDSPTISERKCSGSLESSSRRLEGSGPNADIIMGRIRTC